MSDGLNDSKGTSISCSCETTRIEQCPLHGNKPLTRVVQGLMAFWDYDLFPSVLCGVVQEIGKHGVVKIENSHYLHTPRFILPLEEGLMLQNMLKAITNEEREAEQELRNRFAVKVNKALEAYGQRPRFTLSSGSAQSLS